MSDQQAAIRTVIDGGKQNLLGVLVDGVDYDAAVNRIAEAADSAGRTASPLLPCTG